jgi:exopolyphosphatase/guanosine-5'-triphosphate,3'-diphosphate pyrophosphatase
VADITPRYEFRVWGDNLDAQRQRLEAAAAGKSQESGETYIVSALTDTTNVKIRGGLLDIKELLDLDGGLERWTPTLKEPFPIAAAIIGSKILPGLRVDAPRFARDAYTLEQLIAEIVRPHAKLHAVELTKNRTQYPVKGTTAEFTIVRLKDGGNTQTVAVESEDAAAVRAVAKELGLDGAPNVSYVKALKRMVGLA